MCFAALSLIPESGASEAPPAETPKIQAAAAPEPEVEDYEESYGDPEDDWSYEDDETNFTFGEPMAMVLVMNMKGEGIQEQSGKRL